MRAPNDPQEAQKVPKWSPRGSQRVPKVVQKGPKRDPKGYPKEVQKGGPILGGLYFWILMPVSHGITIFRTCLSKEREVRFFLEELRSLVRQRITADILWKTLSFHVWWPSRMIYRRTQHVTAFGQPFQNARQQDTLYDKISKYLRRNH